MKKGKLIEKYIGEGLEPLHFVYGGKIGNSWLFERQIKDIRQEIWLHEYRFVKNMITFSLSTNVRGKGTVQADDLKNNWNSILPGYWKYTDEEDFIHTLVEIKELLISKGIKALGKLSVPDKITATNEMYHKLYEEHTKRANEYQNKYQIEMKAFDEENINRIFDFIDTRFTELKKGNFEEAKEELVDMAAFLGESLIKYRGGQWEHYMNERDNIESCLIDNIKAKTGTCTNLLHVLIGGYGWNGAGWVKNSYMRFLEKL